MSCAKMLIVGVLCVLMSVAQGLAATEAGDIEVGGQLSLTIPDEGYELWLARSNVGLFLTDQWQLSARVTLVESGDLYGYILGGVDYYLAWYTEFVPYVGGALGVGITEDDTDLGLDGHVGLKEFLDENMSVNYEIGYNTRADDIGAGDIVVTVGLSTYF